jgi:roadblock/LC7 domain-containing protein
MGVPKMSSQDLNTIFEEANKRLSDLDGRVTTIKNDMSQKLSVIKYETDYANIMMDEIKSGGYKNGNMKLLNKALNNTFDVYGSTVHAAFIKEPVNVFNMKVSGSGEVFFRTDVKVLVNDKEADRYTSILKHESLPRDIFFDEFNAPNIKLTIQVAEETNMLGPTRFNVI